jgi:tetratricopeptide (TPR) repeat protein
MRRSCSAAAAAALLAAATVVTAAGGAAARPALAAIDPFYLDLQRDGILSYERTDYPAAVKQLRLACFGMLDEPEQLAACLTRLALAQAAAGSTDSFRETFRRIVEVEDRFGAYGKADLPAEVRAAFEQRALAAVPATTLEAIPAWRALLARKLEAQVAALPPRERRRQLEERLAREPRSVAWNALLAELDLSEGKTAPAVTRAEATAASQPRDARALCVRGLTRAAAGKRCAEAVADLEPCSLCASDARYAAALLGCRVELGQWQKAEEQVRALPAGLRQDRKISTLAQQVATHPAPTAAGARGAGTAPPAPGAGAGSSAGTRSAGGGTPSRGKEAQTAAAAGARATPAAGSAPTAGSSPAAGSAPTAGSAPAGGPAAAAGTVPRAGSTLATGKAAAGQAAPPAAAQPGTRGAAAGQAAATPATDPPGAAGSTNAAGSTSKEATPRGTSKAEAPAAAGGSAPRPLSAAEREAMARSERLLTASTILDLRESLRLAQQLADAHPESKEAQYLAGEAAYRNSRWPEAAAYFRRGGPPGDDHPELLFYMAVAFYEVGDHPGAASALRRSLPNLQKTPFVESYVKRILGQ